MTAPTLRQLLADVLKNTPTRPGGFVGFDDLADALLASPLADILDLAAYWSARPAPTDPQLSPEVRALLAAWRAMR